jgi:hypothetical protein
MSVLQALDIGLAFLVFAVAAWTIFARGAFAATVGYVATDCCSRSFGYACLRSMWR